MIPTITQDAPNIMPRHWCSNCGRKLVPQNNFYKMLPDNFCPGCGERIEWDKAVPVKWEPMNCDVCGKPLIVDMNGHMVAVGYYRYLVTAVPESKIPEYLYLDHELRI